MPVPPADEFFLIEQYFAPLAGKGAFGLKDDVAQISDRIITKDVLVAGVHFRQDDPLDRVARKALRVNISDIIAKGASPECYLLGMVWPSDVTAAQIAMFCEGLAHDQSLYGVSLLGGDTTRATVGAPMVISVTMLGRPLGPGPVRRSGAKAGDAVLVTGTIGDACLGIKTLNGDLSQADDIIAAYQLPSPPIGLQKGIADMATAAIDVSDGLLADAQHLAAASDLCLRINAGSVPLSSAGALYATSTDKLTELLTWGDDYQTLFTVAPENAERITTLAAVIGIAVTCIGEAVPGAGAVLLGDDGHSLSVARSGYRHF